MKHYSAKKLALAGMFCALAVVGSVFSFPVFGSNAPPSSTWSTSSVPSCWGLTMAWA